MKSIDVESGMPSLSNAMLYCLYIAIVTFTTFSLSHCLFPRQPLQFPPLHPACFHLLSNLNATPVLTPFLPYTQPTSFLSSFLLPIISSRFCLSKVTMLSKAGTPLIILRTLFYEHFLSMPILPTSTSWSQNSLLHWCNFTLPLIILLNSITARNKCLYRL